MSILVMGIGVLSVISLFPISFLRTLQATNLTHATILRYNADALAEARGPGLIHNPDAPLEPPNNPANNYAEHDNTSYVIDPLGWNFSSLLLRDNFGNDGPATPSTLRRFNAGITTPTEAANLVTLPDSWVQQARANPTAFTLTSVTLPAGTDLSGVPISVPDARSRVILTDITARVSEVREITSVAAGPAINWDAAFPLPAGFTPTEVRVETQEQRYTWLMTVRNRGDHTDPDPKKWKHIAGVDVVVFFRRALSPLDERIFKVSDVQGRDVTINHNADGTQPFAKKGGYLFDVDNFRWFRIQNSVVNAANTVVTLDRAPINLFDPINNKPVIVPRGIVDVYPIGTK